MTMRALLFTMVVASATLSFMTGCKKQNDGGKPRTAEPSKIDKGPPPLPKDQRQYSSGTVESPRKTQPLRRFRQLTLRPLHVPLRCVEVFVPEDLSQRYEVIAVVAQELVGHRVSEQVRVDLEPANRRVFVTQVSNASIAQCPSFANKDV